MDRIRPYVAAFLILVSMPALLLPPVVGIIYWRVVNYDEPEREKRPGWFNTLHGGLKQNLTTEVSQHLGLTDLGQVLAAPLTILVSTAEARGARTRFRRNLVTVTLLFFGFVIVSAVALSIIALYVLNVESANELTSVKSEIIALRSWSIDTLKVALMYLTVFLSKEIVSHKTGES